MTKLSYSISDHVTKSRVQVKSRVSALINKGVPSNSCSVSLESHRLVCS